MEKSKQKHSGKKTSSTDHFDKVPEISEIQDCSEDIVCIKDTKNSTEQGNQNHGFSRDHAIKRAHRTSTENKNMTRDVCSPKSNNLDDVLNQMKINVQNKTSPKAKDKENPTDDTLFQCSVCENVWKEGDWW